MEPHEKEEHKDKKHTGKMIRTNPNITGAYYSRLLVDSSKMVIQVKKLYR